MTQALQAAAKWKMRVGGAKTDTANVMDAFGKKAPLPKKGWFGGGGGGSAHTVPKPSNASMAENASMPDPALQMAMKWKSKAALPAIGPTPEQLHKEQQLERKKALVAAASWVSSVAAGLHGCDDLCETLKELMKKPPEVRRICAEEWRAVSGLLHRKGLQPEVERLGDIVLDLRNVEEAAITRGASERLEPEKQGQGVLTLAIQSDSLRQIEDTRGVLAAKLELLEVEQAKRLAEDDTKGHQQCEEEVHHLTTATTELSAAILRVKYRTECLSGMLGHKYVSGWDKEVDEVSTVPLKEQLDTVIRELSRVTRSHDVHAVILGSVGLDSAIELKAATELLAAAGAWDCYVMSAPIPLLQEEVEEESEEEEVVVKRAPRRKSFHTENSAINAMIGRGRRHSVVLDPAAERAAANLQLKNLPLPKPEKKRRKLFPSVHLSIYLSLPPSIYLSFCSNLSIYLSASIYLSISASIYLSISASIYLSVSASIYLSISAISLPPSICLSVHI